MKPNVGSKERYLRLGLGILAGIGTVKFSKSKTTSALLGVIAASGIETGLSRYCPLNEVLGIDNAPELRDTPLRQIST